MYLQNKNKLSDIREETCRNGNLVLSESSYYIQDDKTTKSYCTAQGTIFNIP